MQAKSSIITHLGNLLIFGCPAILLASYLEKPFPLFLGPQYRHKLSLFRTDNSVFR